MRLITLTFALTAAFLQSLPAEAQSCNAGYTLCDSGCMPAGATCCHDGATYCDTGVCCGGQKCADSAAGGWGTAGSGGSGGSGGGSCPSGQVICDDGCI